MYRHEVLIAILPDCKLVRHFSATMFYLFIVLLIGLIYLFDYCMKNFGKWKDFYLIPGPSAYPLIGSVQLLFDSTEKKFERLNKYSSQFYPIYALYSFHVRLVFLFHPDDIEPLMTNVKHMEKGFIFDFFHNLVGNGLLASSGSKWQQRRKMLTPAFHFGILKQFIEVFNRQTEQLLEVIMEQCHQPRVDVIPLVTHFSLETINEAAMGVSIPSNDKEKYVEAETVYMSIVSRRIQQPLLHSSLVYKLSSLSRKENNVTKIIHDLTTKIIEEKEKKILLQSKDDDLLDDSTPKKLGLLDLLLKLKHEKGDIDTDGIREEVGTFIAAGHDTVGTALSYILMLLANLSDVQEKTLQEINDVLGDGNTNPTFQHLQQLKYTERIIKESLRLYPSAPRIVRKLGEDMRTKSGYNLPKGISVIIDIYSLHRDPAIYKNPNIFDADRFLPDNTQNRHPFAYIPFSAGSRNCIGQKFAMLEIKAVLCGILRKFKLEAVDTPEDMKIIFDTALRSAKSIYVKFVPRNIE